MATPTGATGTTDPLQNTADGWNGGGGPIPEENARVQAVFVRRDDEVGAMAWDDRVKCRVKRFFRVKDTEGGDGDFRGDGSRPLNQSDLDALSDRSKSGGKQYRLEATNRALFQQPWYWKILTCGGLFSRRRRGLAVGYNPNQRLAMYLHWMFRVNFVFLFAVMCVMFFALVILFSGFITLAGTIDPECVRIGGNLFNEQGTAFADAFALSWTTFSTVGYGSTYPALGYQNSSPSNCFFINFICSLESLLGVLYSGFCGAILFGKVLRIQSQAQVIFSDPILIRYGSGLADANQVGEEGEEKNLCPVLEFRIVNRLSKEIGGEIMDATLNVVANIDADDADPTLRNALEGGGMGPASSRYADSSADSDGRSDTGSLTESLRTTDTGTTANSLHKFLDPIVSSFAKKDHYALDEDPSARLVSKHIFSKMMIEASDHPFFKRVWLARHVLDEHSPVLKPRVRRHIRRNGGSWPDRLNNYTSIRDSLRFNQILVSLNGVSNVSASDVYAQKIYDFVDVNIGYQFVNILYRDGDGQLGVDIDLINDVREQTGGGGEPLIFDD